ncbi:hypothetical protein Tco_0259766 [Tanacetum coccineum]
MLPEDDILPAEEQPLPAAVSPTTDSPSYVLESDPEEDPEDDDDEDPEEDPADYAADRGDNDDDEVESSDDDKDDDVNIEGDEEEEEQPAPADSTAVALPAVDHAPSAEETEPFKTDESAATPPPHHAYQVTARISIRDEPPTPFWSDTKVARLLAIPTPPPSPLSLWSSPLPQIPSPPLPPILSPLLVSSPPPASPTYPLGYRAAMIRLRAEAPSTSHSPLPHIILSHTRADTPPSGTPPSGTPLLLPIPLPTSSPPLHLPSTNHGADRPEVCLPPWKRLCIALGPREIRHDLERDVGYGITDTWDEMLVDMPGAPFADDTELGRRMTEFATRVRQDTDEIYVRSAGSDYIVAGSGPQETDDDYKVAGNGPATRSTSAATAATTSVTNAQLQEMIDQGVTTALAACDANRSTNGDDSHVSGTSGTEGVVELIQWFEKMETVFSISNCSVENQIKFSTCTLLVGALTWWNSHVKTVGHDVAYAMTWTYLKKKMTDKYCPRELALLCVRMFPEESDKIERYDLVRSSHTGVLNPYALNATITMMVHVLPNATSAIELAIWLVTVGVPLMPTLLTTKGALGQVRNPLAMNVEPRDTSRGIVQSLKTTTAVTKLEMVMLQRKCMR